MFCSEGVLSDSEEDKGPEAAAQQNASSTWSGKQSAEQGGYSSEASSERGERVHTCRADAWRFIPLRIVGEREA